MSGTTQRPSTDSWPNRSSDFAYSACSTIGRCTGGFFFLARLKGLRAARYSRRLAYYQLWINQDLLSDEAVGGFFGNEIFENRLTDLFARNMNGCQGRRAEFRESDVVESGDRDVLGYPNALIAQLSEHTHRHEIVHADDGRRVKSRREEFAGSLTAPFQAISSSDDLGLGGRRKTRYGVRKGRPALADRSQRRVMAQEGHSRVTEGVEILHDLFHPF